MRPAPKVTAFVCVICPRFGDQTCLKFMQVYGDIELPTRQKCICVQMSIYQKNGEVVRKEKTLATAINNNLTSRTNERIASVKRGACPLCEGSWIGTKLLGRRPASTLRWRRSFVMPSRSLNPN